jgi:hypothetical protein
MTRKFLSRPDQTINPVRIAVRTRSLTPEDVTVPTHASQVTTKVDGNCSMVEMRGIAGHCHRSCLAVCGIS